jgi:flagellar FliJ protein
MQTRTDDATRRLAHLIAIEKDARSKFEMLRQYRDEYAARFSQIAQNGIAQREWRNYQDFLNKLDEAIDQQKKTVGLQAQHTANGQVHWQQQRTKLQAFDTLSQRHQANEIALEVKREQKVQDEFASRRFENED